MTAAAASRVLVCGSRQWPWPDTVTTLLDRAAARYGDDLVIIEGASTGATHAAHRWCLEHDLPAWRHRCHPLTPAGKRRARRYWNSVERNQRIFRDEGPRLALAFHHHLTPDSSGTTADLCRRALAAGIPVWLVPTVNPDHGMWLPHPASSPQRNTPPEANTPALPPTPATLGIGCDPDLAPPPTPPWPRTTHPPHKP
ncbi:SLOG family protein [Streptoverticillium reticulum]|uniref:SLOG family protein n=1 Tax=Streptoverticillium reticulum TaxID=1433415 RepID=UPI0039BF5D69